MSLSDSFVVAALITKHGRAKAETSIQTKTLHPVWQETLTFPAVEEHMQEGTLTLAVYTCDKYSRRNCLGESQLKLSDLGLEERTDSWICLAFPSKVSVFLLHTQPARCYYKAHPVGSLALLISMWTLQCSSKS